MCFCDHMNIIYTLSLYYVIILILNVRNEYFLVFPGQHTVDIKYADMSIKDSPFHPDVFDPMRVYVSQLPFAVINKAVSFKGSSFNFLAFCSYNGSLISKKFIFQCFFVGN